MTFATALGKTRELNETVLALRDAVGRSFWNFPNGALVPPGSGYGFKAEAAYMGAPGMLPGVPGKVKEATMASHLTPESVPLRKLRARPSGRDSNSRGVSGVFRVQQLANMSVTILLH